MSWRIYAPVICLSRSAALTNAAQIIFPWARREALIGRESRDFLCAQVQRLAMGNCHMGKLAEKRQLNGAECRLLDAGADHRIAVGAQQHRRAVAQGIDQGLAPFDSVDKTGRGINRWTSGRKKLGVHMHGSKSAF